MPTDITPVMKRGVLTYEDRHQYAHPQSWRNEPHKIVPIKSAPYTALTDRMGSREVDDHNINFQTQPYNGLNGPISDVFTKSDLTTAYVSGGLENDPLFLSVTNNVAAMVREGDILTVYDKTDFGMVQVIVLNVECSDDTHSYIAVRLLEDDSNAVLASSTLHMTITSDSHEEVSGFGEGKYEEGVWRHNYTQELRESAQASDREKNSKERSSPELMARLAIQCRLRLDKKREYMRWLNPKKRLPKGRTLSGGFYWWLKQEVASTNIVNYVNDTLYVDQTGQPFRIGGHWWIRNIILQAGTYAESDVLPAFGGGLAIEALQQAFLTAGQYSISESTSKFGLRCMKILGLTKTLMLIQHPLFSSNPMLERSLAIVDPPTYKACHHKGLGLKFIPPGNRVKDGHYWLSAEMLGWRVDEGMEMLNFNSNFWLTGLGLTNAA